MSDSDWCRCSLPDAVHLTSDRQTEQNVAKLRKSSLHNLLPPPREHTSITRLRVSSTFPRIPTIEPENTNHSSHSLPLSDFVIVFPSVFVVVCVFSCLCLSLFSGYYFQ